MSSISKFISEWSNGRLEPQVSPSACNTSFSCILNQQGIAAASTSGGRLSWQPRAVLYKEQTGYENAGIQGSSDESNAAIARPSSSSWVTCEVADLRRTTHFTVAACFEREQTIGKNALHVPMDMAACPILHHQRTVHNWGWRNEDGWTNRR